MYSSNRNIVDSNFLTESMERTTLHAKTHALQPDWGSFEWTRDCHSSLLGLPACACGSFSHWLFSFLFRNETEKCMSTIVCKWKFSGRSFIWKSSIFGQSYVRVCLFTVYCDEGKGTMTSNDQRTRSARSVGSEENSGQRGGWSNNDVFFFHRQTSGRFAGVCLFTKLYRAFEQNPMLISSFIKRIWQEDRTMQPKTPKVIQRDEVIKLGGKATSQFCSYLVTRKTSRLGQTRVSEYNIN